MVRRGTAVAKSKVMSNVQLDQWARLLVTRRSAVKRYTVAVILAVTSLILVALFYRIEAVPATSLAMMSVIFSATYGGRGPAILDAVISAVGLDFFFAQPTYAIFDSWTSIIRILTYFTAGTIIASIVAALSKAYEDLYDLCQQTETAKLARENVLAVVSHDLRSPLSSILMNARFIEKSMLAGARDTNIDERVRSISRSANRMSHMIEDLLDAEKIESGTFRVEPREQKVDRIVTEAIESSKSNADSKGIRLTSQLAQSDLSVYCDRDRIIQVLTNLLGNAIKFSGHGSEVVVEVRREKDWICFEVRDQGVGIEEQYLPSLFSRKWQVTRTAHQGTGLGLYISKSIVEANRGKIGVESKAGQGSTFYFSLPASARTFESERAA